MKKQDFKKLASMGLACGVLLSGQASAIDLNSAETVLAEAGCHKAVGASCNLQAYRNVPSAPQAPSYQSASCGNSTSAPGQRQGQNPETYTQWETNGGNYNMGMGCGASSSAPGQSSNRYMSDTGKSMSPNQSGMQGMSSDSDMMNQDSNSANKMDRWNANPSQPGQRNPSNRSMNNGATSPNTYKSGTNLPSGTTSTSPKY